MFAMQSHWGNIKNCDCIARFFLRARIALQSENQAAQKNAHDHGETASTEAGSKELTEQGGLDDSGRELPLGTIKARCPDPPIAQQTLPLKKHPFLPQFMKCTNL